MFLAPCRVKGGQGSHGLALSSGILLPPRDRRSLGPCIAQLPGSLGAVAVGMLPLGFKRAQAQPTVLCEHAYAVAPPDGSSGRRLGYHRLLCELGVPCIVAFEFVSLCAPPDQQKASSRHTSACTAYLYWSWPREALSNLDAIAAAPSARS